MRYNFRSVFLFICTYKSRNLSSCLYTCSMARNINAYVCLKNYVNIVQNTSYAHEAQIFNFLTVELYLTLTRARGQHLYKNSCKARQLRTELSCKDYFLCTKLLITCPIFIQFSSLWRVFLSRICWVFLDFLLPS